MIRTYLLGTLLLLVALPCALAVGNHTRWNNQYNVCVYFYGYNETASAHCYVPPSTASSRTTCRTRSGPCRPRIAGSDYSVAKAQSHSPSPPRTGPHSSSDQHRKSIITLSRSVQQQKSFKPFL